MSDRYFIRLDLEDRIAWEEIDKTVFDNRKEALDSQGENRYIHEDYVILFSDGEIKVQYSGALNGLTLLMRMVGAKSWDGKLDQPIFESPTHIKFKTKFGGLWMYELETKQKFRINKKAS